MSARSKRWGLFVLLIAAVALAVPVTSLLSTPSYAEAKPVKEAEKGVEELGKVDKKLVAGKAKDASKAFNEAVKHFDKALEYFAEAVVDQLTEDQKQGQKMLDKGSKEIDQAAKELDKGNIE